VILGSPGVCLPPAVSDDPPIHHPLWAAISQCVWALAACSHRARGRAAMPPTSMLHQMLAARCLHDELPSPPLPPSTTSSSICWHSLQHVHGQHLRPWFAVVLAGEACDVLLRAADTLAGCRTQSEALAVADSDRADLRSKLETAQQDITLLRNALAEATGSASRPQSRMALRADPNPAMTPPAPGVNVAALLAEVGMHTERLAAQGCLSGA
jgi:hypothetical protein